MTDQTKARREADRKDADIAAPETPAGVGTMPENPAGASGDGSQTGQDVQRPRDREAMRGKERVVSGFTGTGPSGSQGGRAVHGVAPEDEVTQDELDQKRA